MTTMSEVEINQINANTNKLIAEANKLLAERLKFGAEQGKLSAEQSKMERERQWYPFVIAGTAGAAILAAGAGLAKLFMS